MKKSFFASITVGFLFLIACQNASVPDSNAKVLNPIETPEKKDTTLFYLDSVQLIDFFNANADVHDKQENVMQFYSKRNYAFAWINNYGFNEFAGNFLNLLNQEKVNGKIDSVFFNDRLHTIFNAIAEEGYDYKNNDSLVTEVEVLLTLNFFDYAKRNWGGVSNAALKNVNWFIERKNINYADVLDTILKSKSNSITAYEPVYRQYGLLKKQLQKYYDIEQKGGWDSLPVEPIKLTKGISDPVISSIKKQLFITEDLAIKDTSSLFDDALETALKGFQNRMGLQEDGTLNQKTYNMLSISVHERIQQILINMERSKWVPAEMKGDYLGVNIPEFKLHVYHNDSLQWSCNVIVGKAKTVNNTVIFNDDMQYIVFSPYWNIPKSIIIKETLPSIKRNPGYLSSHNMEVVNAKGEHISTSAINWKNYSSSFPFIIRQKPGKNNSLGLVKFLFPNSYDIYLHDTPQKSLFDENTRAFSHGCIRVEQPEKLATFLLRNDTTFTPQKIHALMNGGKQTFVKLKTKVPVFIAYFTAWVDRKGKLNFREDIYHHDEKMKQLLFAN